jgi:uncharacterized protein YacL
MVDDTGGDVTRLSRRKFGFWYTLWEYKKERKVWQLIKWEGITALLVGTGGSIGLVHWTKVSDRVSTAGDFLMIVSAFLGVVLASFALIVAFLSESYMIQLQKQPKGVRAFFAPFMVNIGVDVGLVIGTVAYRAVALHMPKLVENIFFVLIATLFVYAALNITALTRAVMAHAVTRAEFVEMDQLETELDEDRGA